MPGLVPGIHVFWRLQTKTWMAGTSPAMTTRAGQIQITKQLSRAVLVIFSLVAAPVLAGEIPEAERRSGTAFMSRETQAMQEDERANPGMLAVLDGEALWNEPPAGAKSCAGCHGDAAAGMKGVAARYPAFDDARGRPIDLEQRINRCRTEHQHAPPLGWETR